MVESAAPGRQRAQTRAERGKALYDPHTGDHDDNTGRDTTFRRLEKILASHREARRRVSLTGSGSDPVKPADESWRLYLTARVLRGRQS